MAEFDANDKDWLDPETLKAAQAGEQKNSVRISDKYLMIP